MAARVTKTVTIDVVSDAICPWCFVGKRRMEKALAATRELGLAVTVRWHPFFLDPGLPDAGTDKLSRYREKFGEARMAQMLPYMARTGAADGIKFSYGGKIANTMNAHRIAELAYSRGGAALQNAVMEAMFKFYFEEEGNLGDLPALTDVVVAAGMERKEVDALLKCDALKAEVLTQVRTLQARHGITGVPFFIVDGKYKLSGAQDPAAFVEILQEIATEAH